MKYFEVSKKIELSKKEPEHALKQALLDRLQRAYIVSGLKEDEHGFEVKITTGSRTSLIKNACAKVRVDVTQSDKKASFIIYGEAKLSLSLMIWYTALFFIILLVGLLDGAIESYGEKSGAMDVLVFMILGIFTMYDIDKKLTAVREMAEDSLNSLEAEFG